MTLNKLLLRYEKATQCGQRKRYFPCPHCGGRGQLFDANNKTLGECYMCEGYGQLYQEVE
jgi:uncharacterized protein (DUF983 family)